MAMSGGNTSCRLLLLLGAATLLALLFCQVALAQEDGGETSTEPTTTTTEGRTINNSKYGRGNIIIGGGFGFNERVKRRAPRRRDGNSGGADTFSLPNYIVAASGKRRKNRRRGGGNKNSQQAGELGLDKVVSNEILTVDIDLLAEMNQNLADREQQRPETPSRRRGMARRYFEGVGREIAGFPNRAPETLNNAVSDMLGGVNTVLRMIPYDELEETALRVASYLETLVDSGLPADILDRLMRTRVGDARQTMEALVDLQGSPEQLEPILEDIAENYKNLFSGAAGQVDDFLALILPRRLKDANLSNSLLSVASQLPAILNNAGSSENSGGAASSNRGGFAPPEIAGDSVPPPGAQA